MLNIPNNILVQFEVILKKKVSAVSQHADYKKWLRYYLDFCNKYPVPDSKSEGNVIIFAKIILQSMGRDSIALTPFIFLTVIPVPFTT